MNAYFTLFRKGISYFPTRFMICGFFFSYVLLSNSYVQTVENNALLGLLHLFRIPSYLDSGNLIVGNIYSLVNFSSPINTQILFLIFFPSLAVATSASFDRRLKILFFGGLCFVGLVLTQFAAIVALVSFDITSPIVFLEASLVLTSIVASIFIEFSLFSTITVPKRTNTRILMKRNYLEQYVYLAILFVGSSLLIYFLSPFFQIANNSLTTAYLTVSLSELLFLKYYLSYFIYETKIPTWAKNSTRMQPDKMSITFLMSAYNEEKHVSDCIKSIDQAASKYAGRTEIIVINDGSTDSTREVASKAINELQYASGRIYNIPHSGMGFGLQYGLKRTTGDVIFRTDADSVIGRFAISHIMRHFRDSRVASVSGLVLPKEEKSWWQKIWVFRYCLLTFYKREWELTDSVLVQPGAFCVFKKDALVRVGGWSNDMIGEDCEITVRLGRCGYRHEYEQHAIVFSDIPSNLKELREQRVRWSASFYQAFASNMNVTKEFRSPLSIIYSLRIMHHGSMNASTLFVPFLLAYFLAGYNSIHTVSNAMMTLLGLSVIDFLTYGLQTILIVYFLYKFKKMYLLKYVVVQRLYTFIQSTCIEPEALELLLSVSSKWKNHSRELTMDLRQKLRRGIFLSQ